MEQRYTSTRSKNAAVDQTRMETGGPPIQRISQQSFHDENFQAGDDVNYVVINQSTNNESKQKLNLVWPIYDLCNAENSKLHNFVQSLIIYPRFIITAASKALLNIANDLAAMEAAGKGDGRFEFYYVSAGPLGGGYYLSTLLFRHSVFESEPILPAAFMVHERKSPDDHRRLFELIQEKCPEVASSECIFITDREFGDIRSVLPSALQFFSWHYFEDDIVTWAENNGGTNEETNSYISDVFNLMKSKTVEQFNRELVIKRRQWPLEFSNYFENDLKPDILSKGGRWYAETSKRTVYDPFCGVVIPSCNDLNQLVSDLVEWQEVTAEQLLLCTYYFSEYYVRESEMGRHGSGTYKLKPRFSQAARPQRRLRTFAPSEVSDPRDVVNFVRASAFVAR